MVQEALLGFHGLFISETSLLSALTVNTSMLFDELRDMLHDELALKSQVFCTAELAPFSYTVLLLLFSKGEGNPRI